MNDFHPAHNVASTSALAAWTAAFNRHDVVATAALYAGDAVLWGTTASSMIDSSAGVYNYFEQTFARAPAITVTLGDFITQLQGDDLAIHSGHYALLVPTAGGVTRIDGRFTFVCRLVGDTWIIVNHHSSVTPPADMLPVNR